MINVIAGASLDNFECKLMLGDCLDRMKEIPSGSVDMVLTDPPYGSTACDVMIDESYCIAEKEHHKNANNGNLSKYAASTHSNGWKPKVFIEQDNIKNLTMIHFTKLMANNAMNDNVFFVESIDMKKILHNFKITLDLFTACGRNHELQQHMQKKFNYYKSSEAWTKFLATKSDAYRGLEISVAEFVPEYLAKYNNIEFKKSTVTSAEKCQEIIESGEYLIAHNEAIKREIVSLLVIL
jgi:hypothetical protein